MNYLGRYYRTYALDFWGFGESGKKRDSYDIADFVNLVAEFMDRLGIRSAPLIGHSMGGTVSLSVALRYPDRVKKVVVVGSPIVGGSLSPFLIAAGYKPIATTVYNLPALLRLGIRMAAPLISKDPNWYTIQAEDLSRTTLASFFASIASLRRTDLRPRLTQLNGLPVMGIYGKSDNIVNPNQHQVLRRELPTAQVELFHGSAHFPMLDEPERFNATLKAFLDQPIP